MIDLGYRLKLKKLLKVICMCIKKCKIENLNINKYYFLYSR